MSDSTIPEADAAEAKRRAEWLHKHKAHKDWIILSVSEVAVIRDELLILERERNEARAERDILRLDAQREAEQHDRMVGELEKIYDERDEAREELRTAVQERHDFHWELQDAIRERNEARDQAKQMSESNQVLMADVRFYRNAWEQLKEGAK